MKMNNGWFLACAAVLIVSVEAAAAADTCPALGDFFVVSRTYGTIYAIDPATGLIRHLISGPELRNTGGLILGTGDSLGGSFRTSLFVSTDGAFFMARKSGTPFGVYLVDAATGDRTFLPGTNQPDWREAGSVLLLGENTMMSTADHFSVPGEGLVLSYDLASSTTAVLSGPTVGDGPTLNEPRGLTLLDGNTLIVAEWGFPAVPREVGLFLVDISSGDRTFLSRLTPFPMQRTLIVGGVPVGTVTLGDDEGGSGPVANSVVRSVAMVEGRLIAGHTTQRPNGSWTGGLFEIDLFTGDRTLLVGEAYLDDGTVSNLVVVPPSNPSGIVVSSPIGIQGIGNGELVFTSVFEHQIYRFDLNTNELVIVSDVEAQVHPNFRGDLRLSGLAVYPAPDCNENGVADCQDVLDLTSDDCNGDGRPDECEIAIGGPAPGGPFFCEADCDPDCNTNGVPDACDIAGGYSVDCDANLIPDECDTDCNTNGIPDSCDIADCPADPACQDCNNNGVPDFCDIRDGAAQDLDTDGIPDECIEWDDEAKADSFWNTALNWQDDIVPGVSGAGAVESVLINLSGTNVVLDTHASVDSLIMGSTSTLNITDVGDLTIDSANGINNRGNFNIGSGRSLIAAAPLGIAGTTPITLAGATALLTSAAPGDTITNAITIQGQGVIDADLVNQGRIVADVIGGTLHINGPDPKVNHGEMIADNGGTMEFNVDVTGSGTFAFRCNAGARGGCTPPIGHVADGVSLVGSTMQILDGAIFELAGSASIDLTGAVALDSGGTMRGAAGSTGGLAADSVTIFDDGITGGQMLLADWMTLDVAGKLTIGCPAGLRGGCTPPIQSAALHVLDSASVDIGGTMTFSANVDLTVEASATFTLAGDLDNRSTSTATFNWVAGPLTMDGSSQSLEAAGEDRGANLAGFTDNFAIGTLRIASGTVVNMVDTFDNQADGNTTCDEALYLTDLILETGAILNTSGCRVYYQHLTDLSGITLGLGSDVLNIATGDFDGDGDVDLDDYSAVYDCHTGPGVAPDPTPPTTPQQCLDPFDADHDGDLDLADVGHFQRLLADS